MFILPKKCNRFKTNFLILTIIDKRQYFLKIFLLVKELKSNILIS